MKLILVILIMVLFNSCYITKTKTADGRKCKVKYERVPMKPEPFFGSY